MRFPGKVVELIQYFMRFDDDFKHLKTLKFSWKMVTSFPCDFSPENCPVKNIFCTYFSFSVNLLFCFNAYSLRQIWY